MATTTNSFVNTNGYSNSNSLTANDDSERTVNFRLDAFDVEMTNTVDASYDISAVSHSMDFSATAVIFVKTQDMRTTFQFAVDADHLTEVGTSTMDAGIRFYVFDSKMSDASKSELSFANVSHAPTWNWDVSAQDTDASYILQPAHAMLDVSNGSINAGHESTGMISFNEATSFNPHGDDNNIREDKLVKQDFVRHIASEVLNGPNLAGLFTNVDEMMLEIEEGGLTAWDTIRTNLVASRNANPQTNSDQNDTLNPTRALYRQMVERNPDRFDASGNNYATLQNKILNVSDPQPLPFVDGDIMEFEFKINSNEVSVPDKDNNANKSVATRTYRVRLCMVDGSGNNNEFNTVPPSYVYDDGTSSQGAITPSGNANANVVATSKHQRYYEIN